MRQVMPWVGLAVGAMVGQPALGMTIGGIIGNAVDPEVIKGPSIGEGQQTTSQEGQPRTKVWGTGMTGCNIIFADKTKKHIVRDDGKGGPVTENERFSKTYALRICEGKIDGLLRIIKDEKTVYDVGPFSQMSNEDNASFAAKFRFYDGKEDQMPDSEIEAILGVGNAPAFRGTAYIVFPNDDVTDRGGSIPTYRFEVVNSPDSVTTEIPDLYTVNEAMFFSKSKNDIFLSNPNLRYPANPEYEFYSNNGQLRMTRETLTSKVVFQKLNKQTSEFDIFIDHPSETSENGYDNVFVTIGGFHNLTNHLFVFERHKDSNNILPEIKKLLVYSFNENTSLFELKNSFTTNSVPFEYNDFYKYRSMFLKCSGDGTKVFSCGPDKTFIFSFFAESGTCTQMTNEGDPFNPNDKNIIRVFDMKGYKACDVDAGNGIFFVQSFKNLLRLYRVDHTTNISQMMSEKEIIDIETDTQNQTPITIFGTNLVIYRLCGMNENKILRRYTINVIGGNLFEFTEVQLPPQPTKNFKFQIGSGASTGYLKNFIFFQLEEDSEQDAKRIVVYRILRDTVDDLQIIFEDDIKNVESGLPINNPGSLEYTESNSQFVTSGKYDVDQIILDIADDLKIPRSLINVGDVADIKCDGLVASDQYSGGNIIRSLQDAYFFDASEYDGRINFLKRGKSVVASISYHDTVNETYEFKRESAIEYPRKLELLYQNAKVGYAVAKAVAERISPDLSVSGTKTITVPVTMNEDEAAKIVDKLHKVAWAEAEGVFEFDLPSEYDFLVVSDCIGFFTNSASYRLRIDEMNTADGIISVKAKIDRQTAYVSSATGIPLPLPEPPISTTVGNTYWVYLDIPALLDEHDQLGYYNSGTGRTEAWYGAIHQRKDVGSEYLSQNRIPQGLVVGYIVDPIAQSSEHYSDTTNKIILQMFNDYSSPESASQNQLLNELNACAIQRVDGSAEIIQFRDVVALDDNKYELSYLVRGRLNSGATIHEAGAKFVLLRDSFFVQVNSNLLNTTFENRAVSFGEMPEKSYKETREFVGRSQIEFPVDQLKATVEDNIALISWSPRERFGTEINPIRSQHWKEYKVNVEDGFTSQEYLTQNNSIEVDVMNFGGNVTITVNQVNKITGDGPSVSLILTI